MSLLSYIFKPLRPDERERLEEEIRAFEFAIDQRDQIIEEQRTTICGTNSENARCAGVIKEQATRLDSFRAEKDGLLGEISRMESLRASNYQAWEIQRKRWEQRLAVLESALAEHSILQSNLHQTHHGPFAPEWEAKDAALLRSFLISPTGQRLQRLADYYEQKANRQAAHAPADRDHGAGIARGWYECIEWLCKTLPVFIPPKEDDQTTEERKGDSAIRERLSP